MLHQPAQLAARELNRLLQLAGFKVAERPLSGRLFVKDHYGIQLDYQGEPEVTWAAHNCVPPQLVQNQLIGYEGEEATLMMHATITARSPTVCSSDVQVRTTGLLDSRTGKLDDTPIDLLCEQLIKMSIIEIDKCRKH